LTSSKGYNCIISIYQRHHYLNIKILWKLEKILSFWNFGKFWNLLKILKFYEILSNFWNLFWNFGKFVEILEKVHSTNSVNDGNKRMLSIYIIIIWYYLNILIGQEIVTWSSLKTRIDLKNDVLTYWLRENIRLLPSLTELVECTFSKISTNFPKFQNKFQILDKIS
jgi:hypothetical protein